ncbi:cellulose synthase-like protein G3 [Magnolia sinica]|uniref:cellulose synthase-like protein G3 n=1 Tax=Magnolia sinica TaxID=86752 RepID=UPI0026588F6B|nr:cellulose synthase-like protein G3 [Magnolia sinica]
MKGGTTEAENLPLHRLEVDPRAKFNRAHALVYACAILALFYHRSLHLIRSNDFLSFSLFLFMLLSEMVLAFMWAATQSCRWRPIRRWSFPENLSKLVDDRDLPALDVFICTADPRREPPMSVANTALSTMAFDYPTDRISVYVSDDGGSDLTLFAFMEAAKFARHWLPFCRENGVEERCPKAFFRSNDCDSSSEKIKMMYESMKEKVERMEVRGSVIVDQITGDDEREAFKKWTAGFTRQDHPTVIQVLLESGKDMDVTGHKLPNLVYVSREKRRSSHHNFKAGALNVLLRVSAAMSNAPVVLNLDSDMFVNDPQAPRQALCYLLDPAKAPTLAFVQFPQRFHGIDKNDIYGCEHRRLYQINPVGGDGLVGPHYVGSGCFFNRWAFYGGPSPLSSQLDIQNSDYHHTLNCWIRSDAVIKMAHQVARCTYENGTEWGSKVGFRYGSLSEDFFTGFRMHCKGWESVFSHPSKAAFLGEMPINLVDALSQNKRWCIGLLEVTCSRYCPLIFGTARRSLLMALCYCYNSFWSFWCIPITTYGFLLPLAHLNQIPLFPETSNPWFYLYMYLFLGAYTQDLVDFLVAGGTIRRWWNDHRMWMIRGVTSYLFGLMEFSLQQIGLPSAGFNVTCKAIDGEQDKRYKQGMFEFGVASPMLVPLATVAVINLISFVVGLARALMNGDFEEMFVQLFISGFVTVNSWPIYEAMVLRRDGGRMPTKITVISVLLAWFLYMVASSTLRF